MGEISEILLKTFKNAKLAKQFLNCTEADTSNHEIQAILNELVAEGDVWITQEAKTSRDLYHRLNGDSCHGLSRHFLNPINS